MGAILVIGLLFLYHLPSLSSKSLAALNEKLKAVTLLSEPAVAKAVSSKDDIALFSEIEKISKLAKYANGEAEIIFYYAGHGYPDETSKEPYLIPCDISASQIKDGINLNWLYKKLTENNIKKASVFLDACFTGGARNKGLISTRGVKIIPKQAEIPENLIVMAASGNDQAAYPFNEKQHGLFTYFLLKKILESKGKISYKELFESVYSNVGKNAVRKFNSDQEPTLIFGKTAEAFIENLKLVD